MKNYTYELFFFLLGISIVLVGVDFFGLNSIFVSASSTVVISLILKDRVELLCAYYAGTFCGMMSSSFFESNFYFLLMGLVGVLFLNLSKRIIPNMGGRLGTVSFISCLVTYGVQWIFS